MTHRVFSRSAGSSRARPSRAIIEQVRNNPWGPLDWGKNQPGMQAHEELTGAERLAAQAAWILAAKRAADSAEDLMAVTAHKQIVNRVLEPYTYIDVVVTSTSYNNWYALRNHPAAQPEIRYLAQAMKDAVEDSQPVLLQPGEWHLPFILLREVTEHGGLTDPSGILRRISTARCARTSYRTFDGSVATVEQDDTLFNKLVADQPLHASPAEHQATPDTQLFFCKAGRAHPLTDNMKIVRRSGLEWDKPELHGNLDGWIQFRKLLPNEFVPG
jgi:hypothetical protein